MSSVIGAFKFQTINENEHLTDSLLKSQIYFCSPRKLNDPFDCQVDVNKSFLRAINKAPSSERPHLKLVYKQIEGFNTVIKRGIDGVGEIEAFIT